MLNSFKPNQRSTPFSPIFPQFKPISSRSATKIQRFLKDMLQKQKQKTHQTEDNIEKHSGKPSPSKLHSLEN